VTSEFGPRWGRAHNGLDIDGHSGDPVTAAADGTVIDADYDGGYGLTVIIRHGGPFAGLSTAYAHLSATAVSSGDRVERGQRIGSLGATGNAVGDHLHFEVRRGGEALNPREHLEPDRPAAPGGI
jgi:murein DD-endopeptidase MepM/ murein hydrolase activator NlpD